MEHFKKALITGATSGIGEALAKLLADKKIPLILTGRNLKKLEELKQALSQKVPVEIIAADLQSKASRHQMVQYIQDNQVDLLINNAGFGIYGPAISHSSEELLNLLELDGAAVLELTVEAAKSLVSRKQNGIIMNISSAGAFQILPNLAVYAAVKAFVNSFSQSMDFELKAKGVRVLAACPGKVATGFSSRASGRNIAKKPGGLNMSSEFAANAIWKQIVKEKRLNVFDYRYRIGTWISLILPTSWAVKLSSLFMKDAH